jgi:hypothetical protein
MATATDSANWGAKAEEQEKEIEKLVSPEKI